MSKRKKYTLAFGEVFELYQSLNAIKTVKLNKASIDDHLNISQNRSAIADLITAFEETNQKLLDQYGKKDKKGKLITFREESTNNVRVELEKPEEYSKAYQELESKPLEVLLFPIPKKVFDKIEIENGVISGLMVILV